MKPAYLLSVLVLVCTCPGAAAQQNGERNFKSFCGVCHTIGKGKLIGPDLQDVHKRRTDDWLLKFIKSSQSLIKEGDKAAVAIFKEYNQSVMPDPPYSEIQIREIIQYIKTQSPDYVSEVIAPTETTTETELPSRSVAEATDGEIRSGQMLFTGQSRLTNGGPGCISCHHVKNDQVIGGGLLAKDLTDAYSRLNEAGIKAILTSPPFPAMKESYQNAPLADAEAYNLIAFLKMTDEDQYGQHTRDYKQYFLIAGGAGFLGLLGLFSLLWSKRKKYAVNQKIYNRQIYPRS